MSKTQEEEKQLTEEQAAKRAAGIAASQERRKERAAQQAAAKEIATKNDTLHQQAVQLLAEIKVAGGQAKTYNQRRREATERLRPVLTAVWAALDQGQTVGGLASKKDWAKAQGVTIRHIQKIIAGPRGKDPNSVRTLKLPEDGTTVKFANTKYTVVSASRSDVDGGLTLTISLTPQPQPKKYKQARDVFWVPPAKRPDIKGWSKMRAWQKLEAARAAGCTYCNEYNSARSCPAHGWKEKRSWASRLPATPKAPEREGELSSPRRIEKPRPSEAVACERDDSLVPAIAADANQPCWTP